MWLVYMFTNAENGKKYVGISSNIVARINSHIKDKKISRTQLYRTLRENS